MSHDKYVPNHTKGGVAGRCVQIILIAVIALVLSGCGVVITSSPSASPYPLLLTVPTTTLYGGQSVTINVTSPVVPISTVSLSITCSARKCGELTGNVYTAPSSMSVSETVIVTASSSVASVSAATLQLNIDPAPSIASVTPRMVVAGGREPIQITGTGFMHGSTILVEPELTGNSASIANVTVVNDTTILLALTTAPGEAGSIAFRVQGPVSSSPPSSPFTIQVQTASVSPAPNLPVFPVSRYGASGSSQAFTCSGQAGSTVLTCREPATDFATGQGIRIVGGGDAPSVPAITEQPAISHEGNLAGEHTYCYIVYAADALGGIGSGSPRSCVSAEPELSFTGTFNLLGDTYRIPVAAFLWYRSMDGGPYRLISIGNQSQDVGQAPGAHGGWSDPLPADGAGISKNEDVIASVASVNGNQIILAVPLNSSVADTVVDHDDTDAIQSTINAAVAAGGGVVRFGDGTFNIRRPSFQYANEIEPEYTAYTTSYTLGWPESEWYYLYVPNGSSGNIFFQGNGASTVLQTPPDQGAASTVFGIGAYLNPGYAPFTALQIEDVDKGATSVNLASDPAASNIHPGTDIWLYSGAFSAPAVCVNADGTAGGNCHFSEINTVTTVSGRKIALAYPTSKRYYDDGTDSFGIVVLPVTPHNIGIQDLTFNTCNRILYSGMIYGLVIDHVVINGVVGFGAFGGGSKRDVLIENSTWSFGRGDASGIYDEYDQFTNLEFLRNTITGYAASEAEGPSEMARIYMTEGTSGVVLDGNVFDHVSTYFQDTTDDVVENNTYTDGILQLGDSYAPKRNVLDLGGVQNPTFTSFASQESAIVRANSFTIGPEFTPPWVLSIGHFTSGSVSNNVISYNNAHNSALIISDGGAIKGNTISIGPASTGAWGIGLDPDEAPSVPPASFDVENNTISASSLAAGIYVADPGFTDTAPVCIQGNTMNIGQGNLLSIQDPGEITEHCP